MRRCGLDGSRRKRFGFSLCAAPLRSSFVSISESEIKVKSDEREKTLSQASRGTEGIKLIFKLQNYKVIYGFKYEMSVAEFGDVGNADYDKAVTKELSTGTRY